MCIIIAKQSRQTIAKKHIFEGFDNNPNGAGFMYVKDGKVTIDKGYGSPRAFYKAFKKAEQENPGSPFVLHMRIATSGGIDTENCHPFMTRHGVGFCHNGIISQFSYANSKHSDTWHYVESVLNRLPDRFWTDAGVLQLIESTAVLSHSKFVLLTPESLIIFNEHSGEYCQGVWYSNNGYKPPVWSNYVSDDTPYLYRGYQSVVETLDAMEDESDGMGGNVVKLLPRDATCHSCALSFNKHDLIDMGDRMLCTDCFNCS